MWTFTDKGNRQVCLIPEVTGIIQEMWRDKWSKEWPTPSKIFYTSKCYRYERPQKGRYREFTQFGIEILGKNCSDLDNEAKQLLKDCMNLFPTNWEMKDSVKRGLNYYVQDGFEVECESLGAQKQVAGGGRYNEGVGWAIGIERLMISINNKIN
jgi:histidyl-tRNA synthetase